MLRGTTFVVALFVSAAVLAQSLEERARAHGFILSIDEYEQHSILAKDDSSRFYVAIDGKLSFTTIEVYDYMSGTGDREVADEELASLKDLMPDIWAVTSRPRYYLGGDWNRSAELKFLHGGTMRHVARVHQLLAIMAAEDGRHEDVQKSLRAMQTVSGHASDQPGMIGDLVARSVEELMYATIVSAANYFADDGQGLSMLTDFVGSLNERPLMTGLRMEVPFALSLIEQLVSGEVPLSYLLSSPIEEVEGTGWDALLPIVNDRDPLRDRYLRIMLDVADAWGDHAAVVKVQDDFDAELEEDTEDVAVMLSKMVMSVLVPTYSSAHAGELTFVARARITKIGLAAMKMRRTSGEWPTLDAAAQTAGADPADPFGDRLHYVPSGDSLTMYSNGRDMADNGGKRREGADSAYDWPIVTFRVSS